MNSIRLLYLGETIQDSYTVWCLRHANRFGRIDHLTKSTLDFTHVHMNPLPDIILIKCDWEDHELAWVKRYSIEIPKIFVVCDLCLRKAESYIQLGDIYNIDMAMNNKDISLSALINMITRRLSCEEKEY